MLLTAFWEHLGPKLKTSELRFFKRSDPIAFTRPNNKDDKSLQQEVTFSNNSAFKRSSFMAVSFLLEFFIFDMHYIFNFSYVMYIYQGKYKNSETELIII